MHKFHNILFVSQGLTDEMDALKQALSIARNNKTELNILIVPPKFPKGIFEYKEKFETLLIEQLQLSIQACREAIKISETDAPVQIKVESGSTPVIHIVQHVLKNAYDLVIKAAEPKEDGKGFKAVDMGLLRKCPCPIWLCRPISQHRNEIKVAVAIDPENTTPEAHDLSLRLLALSHSLASTCNGELNVISCWDYELEGYLRRNAWVKM